MKILKALLMIFLIVTIPVNISLAYSGALSDLSISLGSGQEKLAKQTDTVDVSVNAALADDQGADVDVENVQLIMPGFEGLMDCSGGTCTFETGERDFATQRYDLSVTLLDPSGRPVDTATGFFFVDGNAPTIDKFVVPSSSTGQITISYRVTDSACPGCGSFCSGLDRIEFRINDTTVKTVSGLTGCSESGTANISSSDGLNDICMFVYDRFGNEANSCGSTDVDGTPPSGGTIKLEQDGTELKYSSPRRMNARISAVIDSDASSIVGTFSDFNSLNPGAYTRKQPDDCNDVDSGQYCYWDIIIYGVLGTAEAHINMTDSFGNSNEITKTFELPLDSTGPVVEQIGPENNFISTNSGNFTVIVSDEQSGMANQIFLSTGQTIAQAYNCTPEGSKWSCIWHDVSAAGSDGDEVNVRVTRAEDVVGNPWNEADSVKSESFTIDGTAPVFLDLSIGPLGSDLEVLRPDDVVQIKALIFEEAGLDSGDVYADISDLHEGEGFVQADSCEKVNETTYECTWEYGGELDEKTSVRLNARASDFAGNLKDSATDGIVGESYIAAVKEKKADYWDYAESFDVSSLNRNFLHMSNTGTYIRSGVKLVSKGRSPYVHGFEITGCQGSLIIPGKENVFESYTMKDQFYFPGVARSEKYVLINIPNYAADDVKDATKVEIDCTGEVIQGSSMKSSIFTPNEQVNISMDVLLTNSNFERPDINTVDKITQMEGEIKSIDQMIDWISFWVDLLSPLCTMFQLVRQLIDGVCIITQGIFEAIGQETGCPITSWKLDWLWKGSPGGQSILSVQLSSKSLISLGFVCDLVLCEECSGFWHNSIGEALGKKLNGYWKGAMLDYGSDKVKPPQLSFDPKRSLFVAVLCWPPCLPGILGKLQTYKTIAVTYNTCMNVATIRGEDISQCDDYFSSQVCQQVVGEFWYLVDGFIKQFIMNWIMYVFQKKLAKLGECPVGWWAIKEIRLRCMASHLYEIAGWFLSLLNTFDIMEQLLNHQWLSNEEVDSGAKERLSEA